MSDKPVTFANPAVVGLAGFGGTTLLLQFFNLGWIGSGVVLWTAFFFGGLAQLIAGFMEFRTGNSFGLCAFSTYGAFWLALGGIFVSLQLNLFGITTTDLGAFLLVFTIITLPLMVAAFRQNGAISFLFLTLFLGFIFLDISHLGGPAVFTTVAAFDLILCALTAWYLMAHIIFGQLGVNLPVCKAWIR